MRARTQRLESERRVLSAFVKVSRQFKQREKRLLKVVTVNLPFCKQL